MGKDHALIMSKSLRVFAFGSNAYGQLGVHRSTGLHYHLHPLTRQKLYYAPQPIEVAFFTQSQNESSDTTEIFAKQVACGDCFSLAVSTSGEVYSWGVGTYGQLGVPMRKGNVENLIDCQGIIYSKVIQKVRGLEKDPIEAVTVGAKHIFA